MAETWLGVLLAIALLAGTTTLHYEGLLYLRSLTASINHAHRLALLAAFSGAMLLHIIEICLYALASYLTTLLLPGSRFETVAQADFLTHLYFSAQNYTALGYGDLIATGSMRVLAVAEPLNGLMLLAWSGAFLYGVMHDRHTRYLEHRLKLKEAKLAALTKAAKTRQKPQGSVARKR